MDTPTFYSIPDLRPTLSQLQSTSPLLLLPVRIETRFTTGDQSTALKIRVYPDQLHLDEHEMQLTAAEQNIGHAYWTAWHDAGEDEDAKQAAREWLSARVAPRRAAWIARRTEPTVVGGALNFPSLTLRTGDAPAKARCLPERWVAVGYVRDVEGALVQRFVSWGADIPPNLHLSLDGDNYVPWSPDPQALPVDPGLAWMVDFDEAKAKGMALEVDLAPLPDVANEGLALLLVYGVSGLGPGQGSSAFNQLLRAHTYADGLAFLPQGTPTNNTDAVESGWTASAGEGAAAMLARELDDLDYATDPESEGVRFAKALGITADDGIRRAENAWRNEEGPARSMNQALWPVTFGEYFDTLLANKAGVKAVPQSAVDYTEQWFTDHVRGGAPLPSLRVGNQPYGLLPVQLTETPMAWQDATPWLGETLLFLRDKWVESLAMVPRMDPVLGASGGASTNDPESIIVEILGSLAHPRRFLVRGLEDQREQFDLNAWLELLLALLGLVWVVGDDPIDGYDSLSVLGRWNWNVEVLTDGAYPYSLSSTRVDDVYDAGTLDGAIEQLDAIQDLDDDLPGLLGASLVDDARAWVDRMRSDVERHLERQAPLSEMNNPILSFSGVLSRTVDDPKLFYSLYHEDDETRLWNRDLVELSDAEAGEHAADYLASLASRVTLANPPAAEISDNFHANEPLLYQLLDTQVPRLSGVAATDYAAALNTLAAVPAEEIELRMRETLGLATHRLDAWFTSLARARLDELRAQQAGGLLLGGYGWVIDLKPDAAGTSETQGFIHAPSIQQATTAAILRAGWSAHGTDEADSTLAVDLRGDRVREARWLLDGVRQGQGLDELLGYRLERRLHDENLDEWIDPLRRAALVSVGRQHGPRGSVDGLVLAELHAAEGLGDVLAEAATKGDDAALTAALDDMLTVMDAIGDLGIAESVHQVAQGNMHRSAATLDALALGEVPPPELHGTRTPRGGTGITHRLGALLGDSGMSSAGGARASFDGLVEGWVHALLDGGDQAMVGYTSVDAEGVTSAGQLALSTVYPSVLDALFEAPAGDPGETSLWARRIFAYLRGLDAAATHALDFDPAGLSGAEIPLVEFAELARALRAILARGRALDARDLAPLDEDAASGRDFDELESRVATLTGSFNAALGALGALLPTATEDEPHPVGEGSLADLRAAMRELADFALPGAVPSVGWVEDERDGLYAEAWSVYDRASARSDELAALETEWAAEPLDSEDEDGRLGRARRAVTLLLGAGFPVLPRFAPVDHAAAVAPFAVSDTLLDGDAAAPMAWVQALAKVRPEVARFDELASVTEMFGGTTKLPLVVGQLPTVPGELWAARTKPTAGTGGRLSMVLADFNGLDKLGGGSEVAGLVIDEWVESIPKNDHTTGIAFHFDSPAARAPQAMLLAVPTADQEGWDFELITAILRRCIEDAQLRAVGPETLAAYGHHFPAIFAPTVLDAGPQPEPEPEEEEQQ